MGSGNTNGSTLGGDRIGNGSPERRAYPRSYPVLLRSFSISPLRDQDRSILLVDPLTPSERPGSLPCPVEIHSRRGPSVQIYGILAGVSHPSQAAQRDPLVLLPPFRLKSLQLGTGIPSEACTEGRNDGPGWTKNKNEAGSAANVRR